jgi:hypothetical protein
MLPSYICFEDIRDVFLLVVTYIILNGLVCIIVVAITCEEYFMDKKKIVIFEF